ncbi:MAG: DnaJ C-terminal domain-containing protein [Desulfobacterales bacterium]
MGGPPGDLYVFISVKPHGFLKRHKNDVICTVELSFVEAALGGEVQVPTLTGEETLKIPKGTQYADTFRLPGQGIPSLRSNVRGSDCAGGSENPETSEQETGRAVKGIFKALRI